MQKKTGGTLKKNGSSSQMKFPEELLEEIFWELPEVFPEDLVHEFPVELSKLLSEELFVRISERNPE